MSGVMMSGVMKVLESGHPEGVPQTSLYGTATDRESLSLGRKTRVDGGDVGEV